MAVQQHAPPDAAPPFAASVTGLARQRSTRESDIGRRPRHQAQPAWRRRTELELVEQQLRAITLFTSARRSYEEAARAAATAGGESRERRMDTDRMLAVLTREQDALVARVHDQLRWSGGPRRGPSERRAVLAHRHPWFVHEVVHALEDGDVRVVGQVDNGADAVGIITAEQPDLVLVQDSLVMLSGEQVVRDTRRFSPSTLIAAQADGADGIGPLLEAGATAVFTRRVPPVDVALTLLELLRPARVALA